MQGTLIELNPSSRGGDEGAARFRVLIGGICAFLVMSLVVGGYLILRRRHAQQTLQAVKEEQGPPAEPKGPPKARIFIDDAVLKGDQTLVAGTVKNISNEQLSSLSVDLELIRRRGSITDKTSVQVEPSQLGPQEEGRYTLPLRSADYISVRLIGLKSGSATALVYTSALGQKRPTEKTESKTVIVKRPSSNAKEGFLNTPDTPGRVP